MRATGEEVPTNSGISLLYRRFLVPPFWVDPGMEFFISRDVIAKIRDVTDWNILRDCFFTVFKAFSLNYAVFSDKIRSGKSRMVRFLRA